MTFVSHKIVASGNSSKTAFSPIYFVYKSNEALFGLTDTLDKWINLLTPASLAYFAINLGISILAFLNY